MRRRVMVTVGGLAALAATGTLGGNAGAAGPAAGFTLVARADPMALQVVGSEAPVVPGGEVVYATPSSAQAAADSLGSSRAFASAPYAGDFFTTLPGTVNGVSGGKFPPLPQFPFYVSSEYPSRPSQEFSAGSHRVKAQSANGASAGDARAGLSTAPPEAAASVATAAVNRDAATGVLVAEASSELQPLALTNDVRIGEVRSTVKLRFDPAAPERGVEKTSQLRVGTIVVAGLQFGVTDKGVTVVGNPLVPVDASAAAAVLHSAGVEFEYVPAVATPTSLSSASIRVVIVRDAPRAGVTRTTFVLGQASATVDPTAPAATPAPVELPPGFLDPTPLPPDTGPVAPLRDPAPGTVGSPGRAEPVGTAGPVLPAEQPAISAPPAEGAAPGPTGEAAAPGVAPALTRAGPLADTARLYPVLVLAGLAALLASRRTTWTQRGQTGGNGAG